MNAAVIDFAKRATDAQIEEALDRGDFDAAGRLAASVANPAAFRKAKNIVLQQRTGTMNQIEYTEHTAKLTKIEADMRVAGVDNPEPTIEVDVELNMPSELLPMFDPTLRSMLFHKNGAVQHDLASQTHDAPDVRYPKMKFPLVWESRIEGATFTVHKGLGGVSDLVLGEASIKNFRLTPMEGGTVAVAFNVRAKPAAESAFGRLATMLKSDVSISLELQDEGGDNDGDE